MTSTREEQIALVRQKCIEANSDFLVGPCLGCARKGKAHLLALRPDQRPIRLADVLLALDGLRKNEPYSKTQRNFEAVTLGYTKGWNLRKDDLIEQSDETIEFIATLLK